MRTNLLVILKASNMVDDIFNFWFSITLLLPFLPGTFRKYTEHCIWIGLTVVLKRNKYNANYVLDFFLPGNKFYAELIKSNERSEPMIKW